MEGSFSLLFCWLSRFIYDKRYDKINDMYKEQLIPSELGLVIGAITESQKYKILLIQKKSQRGDSMEKIIDDLMESIEFVQPIYEMIKQNPELSVDEIYGIISK